MATKLNSFNHVIIPRNSLVVLDIDDTVIKFEEMGRSWWAEKESQVGHDETLRIWIENAHVFNPVLTEPDAFPSFLQRIFDANAYLVFLTARCATLKELTMTHLTKCGINVAAHNVYFSRNKGECLKSIVQTGGFCQVIFIDDMEYNIESVITALKGLCDVTPFHYHK